VRIIYCCYINWLKFCMSLLLYADGLKSSFAFNLRYKKYNNDMQNSLTFLNHTYVSSLEFVSTYTISLYNIMRK